MKTYKIEVTAELTWANILEAVEELAEKIGDSNPEYFALLDADRLENVARTIRNTVEAL